jgi:hypothetical protein
MIKKKMTNTLLTLEHLSNKDKQIFMKLVEKLEELEQENEKQFKSLENQDELIIEKITLRQNR